MRNFDAKEQERRADGRATSASPRGAQKFLRLPAAAADIDAASFDAMAGFDDELAMALPTFSRCGRYGAAAIIFVSRYWLTPRWPRHLSPISISMSA